MSAKFHSESTFCKQCGEEIKMFYKCYEAEDNNTGNIVRFCSPECFANYFGNETIWKGYYTNDDDFEDNDDYDKPYPWEVDDEDTNDYDIQMGFANG